MIVADNETAVDLLYYEAIAKTVVRLVNEKSDEPLSVGVHGDWGAGKSSVLMMVEETFFRRRPRALCTVQRLAVPGLRRREGGPDRNDR
ncbi:P-loop NTPase fold protein [Salinisphaera sp. LB1]|uniref:P-loop NTPase fold protein n=1 Tax=Salinisphaera sp. LB1 TaxID=2183911 RepID=UPI00131458B2|nr:P-loop NTPase fold protein [Salinisphaera sp. LB1]